MDLDTVTLTLKRQHFDYIMNVLGTAALRYVDVQPIVNDIAQQMQSQVQPPLTAESVAKANGAGAEAQ